MNLLPYRLMHNIKDYIMFTIGHRSVQSAISDAVLTGKLTTETSQTEKGEPISDASELPIAPRDLS